MKIAERIISKAESMSDSDYFETQYKMTRAETVLRDKKPDQLSMSAAGVYARENGIEKEFKKHSDKITSLLKELDKTRYDIAKLIKQHAEQKRKEFK